MSYKTFSEWIAKSDIFGFNKQTKQSPVIEDDLPIQRFDSQFIIRELLKTSLGEKKAYWDYGDTITWGNKDVEATHVDISPLGSFKVIARKIIKNLQGEYSWICKRVIPLPDSEYLKNEQHALEKITEELELIDGDLDSANPEYDLEKLCIHLVREIKSKKPCKQMWFNKLLKKNENYYIIAMNLMGSGIEAPTRARVNEFLITVLFDKRSGLIRSFGNDIQSPMKVAKWEPVPSEWDENFAPTQPKEEIVEAIVKAFSTY